MVKKTKAQLETENLELSKKVEELEEKLAHIEENKYNALKEEFGNPHNTDEDWINYINQLHNLVATQRRDLDTALMLCKGYRDKLEEIPKRIRADRPCR